MVHLSGDHRPRQEVLEAMAAGALVMVKAHRRHGEAGGLGSMFSLDKEMVLFDTPRDLVRKVRYYLGHDPQRQEIVRKARKTLLERHSTHERVRQMLESMAQLWTLMGLMIMFLLQLTQISTLAQEILQYHFGLNLMMFLQLED